MDPDSISERVVPNLQESGIPSRRSFLQLSAAGLAGASAVGAAGCLGASAGGEGDDDASDDGEGDDASDDEETDDDASDDEVTDIDILNFALTLEYLEARFYREGLDNFGKSGLDPGISEKLGGEARKEVIDELRVIQEHEEAHVEVLIDTINALGGTPIDEPTFDFGTATEDPTEFLQTAALLETTGVSAYAGAAPLIENEDLIPPALGIHSVEARHTSYLNVVNGETGFPNVIDEPQTMDEVLDAAGGFIVEE